MELIDFTLKILDHAILRSKLPKQMLLLLLLILHELIVSLLYLLINDLDTRIRSIIDIDLLKWT